MNFAGVQSITIPEGDVRSIAIGGVTVWEKPNPLPYDAEVDYIESTGTQWIDTGLVVTPTMRMTVDMAVTNWDADTYSLTGAGGIRFALGKGYAGSSTSTTANYGKLYFGLGEQNLPTSQTLSPLKGVRHIYGLDAATATGWLDETSYSLSSAGTISTGRRPIVLFAQSTGATSVRGRQAAKLYGAVFTDNGTIVRDYIPVRVGTAGYLYDRANPTGGPLGNGLYGSATSTPLVAGPDKGSTSTTAMTITESTD